MEYLDKHLIKESLTIENVKKILVSLGSDEPQYDDRKNILIAQTVCHQGEKYKLYYYPDSKLFHCYTDCGDSFDIYELIIRNRRSKGVSMTFAQALRYVANEVNLILYEKKDQGADLEYQIDDWSWLTRFSKEKKHEYTNQIYSETILDMFCYYPHKAWLDDNIGKEAMEKFEIGYWGKENKIVIPHRDIQGNLIGVRGRALNQEDIQNGRKYMPLRVEGKILSHNVGENLYGLYQNKDAIVRSGRLFLVESEKSVLQIETMYPNYNYALAVCGSHLTNKQAEIIKNLGVDRCYIAFDKEYEDHKSNKARRYYNHLCEIAYRLIPYMSVYLIMDRQNLLKEKDSPSDRGKEIFEKLLDDKIEVKYTDRKAEV